MCCSAALSLVTMALMSFTTDAVLLAVLAAVLRGATAAVAAVAAAEAAPGALATILSNSWLYSTACVCVCVFVRGCL